MKIRIQNQKLIYRLQNEDLAILKKNKYCEESLQIGTHQLSFAIESQKIDQEKVFFEHQIVKIIIPENILQKWLDSEVVEMEFMVDNTQLIIEKDLKEFRRYALR